MGNMENDPARRPSDPQNVDVERDIGTDERVPARDRDGDRTVEPEDEERRVRPGERRPPGTMP